MSEENQKRGDRGELGTATAGSTVKHLWKAACFKRVDAKSEENPNKRKFVPNDAWIPLKEFARRLSVIPAPGYQEAKDWWAHKHGSLNLKRSEKNVARISEESRKSKEARRSKKNAGGGAAKVEKPAKGKVAKGV
jgi:hypothetical protein